MCVLITCSNKFSFLYLYLGIPLYRSIHFYIIDHYHCRKYLTMHVYVYSPNTCKACTQYKHKQVPVFLPYKRSNILTAYTLESLELNICHISFIDVRCDL